MGRQNLRDHHRLGSRLFAHAVRLFGGSEPWRFALTWAIIPACKYKILLRL